MTWRNKKQNVVFYSSAEVHFRAMAVGICYAIWLKRVLEELQLPLDGSMKLYHDNMAAINVANNLVQHDRGKCMEIDRLFIKEKLEKEWYACQCSNHATSRGYPYIRIVQA